MSSKDEILKKAKLPISSPFPPVSKRKEHGKGKDPSWHDFIPVKMTPELQNDIQLLRLRHALDPHRHYKRTSKNSQPDGVQVGTIIEGPAEFFSSRLHRRQRSSTLLDTLLKDELSRSNYKRKFLDLQTQYQSGGKHNYRARRNARLPRTK
jgi:hypothetical protein